MTNADCYRILQARRLRAGDPGIRRLAAECESREACDTILRERRQRLRDYFASLTEFEDTSTN